MGHDSLGFASRDGLMSRNGMGCDTLVGMGREQAQREHNVLDTSMPSISRNQVNGDGFIGGASRGAIDPFSVAGMDAFNSADPFAITASVFGAPRAGVINDNLEFSVDDEFAGISGGGGRSGTRSSPRSGVNGGHVNEVRSSVSPRREPALIVYLADQLSYASASLVVASLCYVCDAHHQVIRPTGVDFLAAKTQGTFLL
jgi:hypothetical protein